MWRDIKEYEGLYEINENAVVRRVEGKGIDGRKVTTHVVVSSKTRKGTRYIALWKDGNRKTFMLHKIYAEAFYMSENEACRRLYKGFIGYGQAVQNVKDILLRNLSDLEKEQSAGENRHDEILYIQQFLDELKDFWPLYEYLKEKGLVISINTNGSLIDEQAVEKFKKSPPCRINITLYGASDETYEKLCRIRNGFQKVDKAVTLLCKAGIPVKLNCSLTPYNVCDLEKIVDYAKKRNLILDINPYMYPPVRKENFKPGFNERFSPEEVAYWHIKSKQLQYEKDAYLDFLQQIVQGTVKPPGLDEECYDSLDGQIRCRAGRAAFWVTWDGYMLPCGMMGAPETDLREYDFANAWKLMIQKADAVNLSGICNNCQNSSICHSCAAMAMAETGRFDGIPVYMCEMVKTMKKLAQEQLKIYGAE